LQMDCYMMHSCRMQRCTLPDFLKLAEQHEPARRNTTASKASGQAATQGLGSPPKIAATNPQPCRQVGDYARERRNVPESCAQESLEASVARQEALATQLEALLKEKPKMSADPVPLVQNLLNCGVTSREHLDYLCQQLMNRLCLWPELSGFYAKLCGELRLKLASKEAAPEVTEAAFKRALLVACQGRLEELLAPQKPRDAASDLGPDAEEHAREKRHRLLGCASFLGHLIAGKAVAGQVLLPVAEGLLSEPITADALEALASLLLCVGGTLDSTPGFKHKTALDRIFAGVTRHAEAKDTGAPGRVRRQLAEVSRQRAAGWS